MAVVPGTTCMGEMNYLRRERHRTWGGKKSARIQDSGCGANMCVESWGRGT